MPELPEVETIRRGLEKLILYKKIIRMEVKEAKSVILGGKKLENIIYNFRIIGLKRFGKALVIDLDSGWSLMVHLRMTGQLIFEGEERFAGGHPTEDFVEQMPSRHTRVIFELENGRLYFNDQRKFGFIKVLLTDLVEKEGFIRKLGKEPWVMSGEELYEKLQRHQKTTIKAVILNQTVMAGLGNIYADEALFWAGVLPTRRVGTITKVEVERILEGARRVMDVSIASGGSTMATYVQADGSRGDYLEKFAKVFRREGQLCLRCGGEIKKIKVSGRGTYICLGCQK